MKITDYGKDVVIKIIYVSLGIDVIAFLLPYVWLKLTFFGISTFLILFTLYFFRDPVRKLPKNISKNSIISPADGKVVLIEKVKNNYTGFFEDKELLQISIFLSPLNVHINCFPVSGIIKYFNYIKGDYIVAFNHKSSEKNERTEIGIETADGKKVLFKQIAGFVARRIVCDLKLNDIVKKGEKFGMIKFGSRVDILISNDSNIKIKLNDKVKAGINVIAEIK